MGNSNVGNFGQAILDSGAVNQDVMKWRLEHVIPKDTRTVYYCSACNSRMKFHRCSMPEDNYYRCAGCFHEIPANQIEIYAEAVEEEI